MALHYALWLIPPPAVQRHYARLIEDFSRRFGTPRFDPHVTLCSVAGMTPADALARARALAARLPPVPLRLTEIGYTDEYFRCFFIHAERGAALLAAHRAACEQFGTHPAADYRPHLSLIYGTLSPECKERLAEEIGRRVDATFTADRIALCVPDGPPQGWILHGPFPLAGDDCACEG